MVSKGARESSRWGEVIGDKNTNTHTHTHTHTPNSVVTKLVTLIGQEH